MSTFKIKYTILLNTSIHLLFFHKQPILFWAINVENIDIVNKILDQHPSLTRYKKMTPLELSISKGNLEITLTLIHRGEVPKGDIEKTNAFRLAVGRGMLPIVELLYPQCSTTVREEALFSSIYRNKPAIVGYLIQQGVSINATEQNT